MELSVIVPVYNVENSLEQCIQSVILQSYRFIELFLIDDGSPDNCAEICDRFASIFGNIIVIHKPNGGVSSARNKGLDCATGDLITFVDSDDTIDPDMYATLISYLDSDTDIVHCSYKRIQNGETINIGGSGEVLVQNNSEALEFFLLGKCFTGALWNKVFRSSILHSLRFSEDLVNNEDFLLCFQLFNKSRRSTFIDICKYNYIVRQESATNTINELRKLTDSLFVCQNMYDQLTDPHLKHIAYNRLVSTDLAIYQCLICNHIKKDRAVVKNRLKQYKKDFSILNKHNRIILFSLLYAPHIYCGLYGIYDKIRKPNWDVN